MKQIRTAFVPLQGDESTKLCACSLQGWKWTENRMKLTNTACLAALLLACPLAATTVHGADYDVHYNDTPDTSGTVASSGNKETPTGEWDDVYIGHAYGSGESVKKIESSNNEGTLGEGLTVVAAWGGSVGGSATTAQANANTLILKKDVGLIRSGDRYSTVTGGYSSGNFAVSEACNNTVTFE